MWGKPRTMGTLFNSNGTDDTNWHISISSFERPIYGLPIPAFIKWFRLLAFDLLCTIQLISIRYLNVSLPLLSIRIIRSTIEKTRRGTVFEGTPFERLSLSSACDQLALHIATVKNTQKPNEEHTKLLNISSEQQWSKHLIWEIRAPYFAGLDLGWIETDVLKKILVQMMNLHWKLLTRSIRILSFCTSPVGDV